MSRWITWLVVANVLAIAVLVFRHPQWMVSAGNGLPAHAAIATDCFACHAPLRGVPEARCTTCHRPADIGRVTTTGKAVAKRTPFHQSLSKQDCTACHREHADRLTPVQGTIARFDHSLLRADQAGQCKTCHQAPATPVHRKTATECAQCHLRTAWRPATFDHARLSPAQRAGCVDCHAAPRDPLHATAGSACGQCHRTTAWTPATFDHARYFPLSGDHRATCATCHPGNDTTRYTCYGCHAHTPANVRAEHIEEGIRDYLDCAGCHGPRAAHTRSKWQGRDRDDED